MSDDELLVATEKNQSPVSACMCMKKLAALGYNTKNQELILIFFFLNNGSRVFLTEWATSQS